MNVHHYRMALARLGVLAFGLLIVFLVSTVVEQSQSISDLTNRLTVQQQLNEHQQASFRAAQELRQQDLIEAIATLKVAIGTGSSPAVEAAVNELLSRVRNPQPGPPGPTGPQGRTGETGPRGADAATTSTDPAASTTTTRQTATTTSPTRAATTTTTVCAVGVGNIVRLGCR